VFCFQAEDGIRDPLVTGVQTCALPIYAGGFDATRAAVTAVGAALFVLFVGHALARGRGALIDLSLFGRRGFAAAAATNFLLPVRSEVRRVGKECTGSDGRGSCAEV